MWAQVFSNNNYMATWFMMSGKDRASIPKLMFICNVWDWEFIQATVIKTDHVYSHVYNGYEWFLMTSGYEMITGGESPQFRFRDKSKTLFYNMHGIIAHLIFCTEYRRYKKRNTH